MKYLCVKDLEMEDDGAVAFSAHTFYEFEIDHLGDYVSTDDQGSKHAMPVEAMPYYFKLSIEDIKHGDWILFNPPMRKPVIGIVLHIAGDYVYTTEGPCNLQDVLERR